MELIEVDPVGLEPSQARLHRRHDIAARGTGLVGFVVHRHAEFGGEHDVLAARTQYLTKLLFRSAAIAIDVGSVEQGDALLQRAIDHLARGIDVEDAEIVAAKADDGDFKI